MSVEESRAVIEKLMEYFIADALGLTLEARVPVIGLRPAAHGGRLKRSGRTPVWAHWHTDRGSVTACGRYDHAQSRCVEAHVLWIVWWIAPHEHHEGWWHCYPKRPREWIKGIGTPIEANPKAPPNQAKAASLRASRDHATARARRMAIDRSSA